MKLDVLALAAHPDDVELAAAGTLLKLKAQGYKTGILDFTEGELGTRGTPESRKAEAAKASEILGIDARANVGIADGFFQNDEAHVRAIVPYIRHFRPEVVLLNAPEDRHPDHGRAAKLGRDACWLSGLRKIETTWEGRPQEAFRPKKLLHYIQDRYLAPSLIVDITGFWADKLRAIQAFGTQVHTQVGAASSEPETYISRPVFLQQLEARSLEMGHAIGSTYGEGFISVEPLKVEDLTTLATIL